MGAVNNQMVKFVLISEFISKKPGGIDEMKNKKGNTK